MSNDSTERHLSACAYVRRTDLAVVRLDGGDALDFLQRISTNDVRDVNDARMATTLLCTDKGRILDIVRVVHHGDALHLIVSRVRKEQIIAYLRTYIIMDDVRVRDCSDEWECVEFTGPGAAEACSALLAADVSPFPAHAVYRGADELRSTYVISVESRWENSFLVTYPVAEGASRERMEEYVSAVPELRDDEAEILRMERGIPATDKELTVEHNPLEANLLHFINFRKGCYIGQEVIARLDSYNKVKVRLVGIRCSANVREKSVVVIDGVDPGVVTSVGVSPRYGPIALAYVRTEYATQGRTVMVRDEHSGDLAECTIQELPFS